MKKVKPIGDMKDSIVTMTVGSDTSIWALAIMDAAGHIEGVTRLQKYAFLIAKRVKGIIQLGFYNDWEPSNYGPFSKQLAKDIGELIEKQLVLSKVKPNKYGYNVGMLTPTESATGRIRDFKYTYPKYYNEITKFVSMYNDKRLIDVLHDVYYLYPEFATQSKIKAQVGRQIYESDSYLNPEYDNSSD